MQSSVFAQKTTAYAYPSPEEIFSKVFYAPYCAAVETAFFMIDRARSDLARMTGEDTVRRMTFRLKSPESIVDKLRKKGLPVTAEAAGAALHDVAGLRVVLSSVDAVYRYAALLRANDLAEVHAVRDYIAAPKTSGYRSLHLLINAPVISGGRQLFIPAEIQLRTDAMDDWAVAEHDAYYKPVSGIARKRQTFS